MDSGTKQMSQSLIVGALLALAGGMLDAYTFLCRGGLFATAETGNLVMLGVSAARGDFTRTLYYVLSVAAFAAGIFTAEHINANADRFKLHWRQWVVLIECAVVACAAFVPESGDLAVCIMVSYISAIQLEAFRKFAGRGGATTMCTGNLRSASELLYKRIFQRGDAGAHVYGLLIVSFVAGATVLGAASGALGDRAVLLACLPLAAAFLVMFVSR